MTQQKLLCTIGAMFTAIAMFGQETWTLEKCIAHAKEQNITIQQQKISQQEADIELKQAKAAFWPTLSVSSGHTLSNRPSQDPTNTYNGTVGINAGWIVFDGTRKSNIELSKVSSKMAQFQTLQTENQIVEQLLLAYVQTIYAKEAIEVNRAMLAASEAAKQQGAERLKLGDINKSDYAQLQAQMAQDNYNLVSAQAQYDEYMLQLKQLLELESTDEINLVSSEYSDDIVLAAIPELEQVYQSALLLRPEIQNTQLQIEQANLNLKVAKAGYYPTINLSASSGTSWSKTLGNSTNSYMVDLNSNSNSFADNWSNSIGLNISIPITQNRKNKSAVEKAKLSQTTAALMQSDEKKTLRKTIEELWLDANSNQQQYLAAQQQTEATQASYDLIAEQFAQGLKTATDLMSEKATLLQSEQSMLQSKYMALYAISMLQFYEGANISL